MEAKKPTGDFQRNLNTILLAICVGLSSWVLVTLNAVEVDIATLKANRAADHDANAELQREENQQADIISRMELRLNTVETLQRTTKQ